MDATGANTDVRNGSDSVDARHAVGDSSGDETHRGCALPDDNVLLEARVNVYDAQTHRGKVAATRRLTNMGDHVAWHDGGAVTTWRLPDQAPLNPDVPVLSRAVLLSWKEYSESASVAARGHTSLVLVDDHNHVLATLISASDITDTDIQRLWPETAFATLAARGVPYVEEQHEDSDEVARLYPGSVSGLRRSYTSKSSARRTSMIVYVIGAVLVGALLIAWLMKP